MLVTWLLLLLFGDKIDSKNMLKHEKFYEDEYEKKMKMTCNWHAVPLGRSLERNWGAREVSW